MSANQELLPDLTWLFRYSDRHTDVGLFMQDYTDDDRLVTVQTRKPDADSYGVDTIHGVRQFKELSRKGWYPARLDIINDTHFSLSASPSIFPDTDLMCNIAAGLMFMRLGKMDHSAIEQGQTLIPGYDLPPVVYKGSEIDARTGKRVHTFKDAEVEGSFVNCSHGLVADNYITETRIAPSMVTNRKLLNETRLRMASWTPENSINTEISVCAVLGALSIEGIKSVNQEAHG